MKHLIYTMFIFLILSASCSDQKTEKTTNGDTTTNAVRNAEGNENNAYNLPGEDTAAIHQNTTEPGVLNKDAGETQDGTN